MANRHGKLNRQEPSDFRGRFVVAGCIVFFAFFLLLGRVWYLQVLKGGELRERSENNRIRVQEIKPLRGLILDSQRNILVDNNASFDIALIPEEAGSVDGVIASLRNLYEERNIAYTGVPDPPMVRKRFLPVTLERDVTWDKLALVEMNSTMLPGMIIDVVPVRNYTMGPALAHVLGYVGEISRNELLSPTYREYRSGSLVGKAGIEKVMDRQLRGKSGGAQVEVNVAGQVIDVLARIDPKPGCNIVTTLDRDLQQVCWDSFDKPAGAVVVMDPNDGSILAMVSKPSFDPNLFNRGINAMDWEKFSTDSMAPFKNRAVSGLYPPASLFKLIIAAAALDRGLITGDETIFCRGAITLGDRDFRCWKREGHGALDLHQAIVQSCDVFFYTLGLQLGIDDIAEYAVQFGLGVPTGIDIPGERAGLVPTSAWKRERFGEPWQRGETVSVSIGQGFLNATPLQLARAFSAIANGGTLYKPRIIRQIESSSGEVLEVFPVRTQGRLPLSQGHLDRLRKALHGAVNEPRGTGRVLRREERDVFGKTGTAQVISMPDDDDEESEKTETPFRFRDHALFVCSVPYDDPRITVMVVAEHGGHGGSAAAPIARKIVDWYMEHRPPVDVSAVDDGTPGGES